MSSRHLERVIRAPRKGFDRNAWPFTIPAVRQLVDDGGFDVPPRHGAQTSSPLSVTGPRISDEDSPLRWHLKARTHRLAAPGGFFLRAEAMHGYLSEIDDDAAERRAWGDERMRHRSHGESFLGVLRNEGSKAIVATHSPLIAALPGATTFEPGECGMRRTAWADLDLVRSWQGFLGAPERWLRHLFGDAA